MGPGPRVASQRLREVQAPTEEVAGRPGPQPRLQASVPWSGCASAHERHGIVAEVPGALKTKVTELGDSRVRLQVQVPAAELEGRLERKARQLGSQLKLPGFRRGKVPAPLVIQRMGREVVLEEAVRDTISTWYSDAIETAGIVPVGDPQLDLGELPAKGEDLEVLNRDRRAADSRAG